MNGQQLRFHDGDGYRGQDAGGATRGSGARHQNSGGGESLGGDEEFGFSLDVAAVDSLRARLDHRDGDESQDRRVSIQRKDWWRGGHATVVMCVGAVVVHE